MIKKIMEKVQYISQGNTSFEQLENIENVLKAGVKWIQLRCKGISHAYLLQLAFEVKNLCDQYNAILIINDHIDIAVAVEADGIHLGLSDASIIEARNALGDTKIIGGTANTLEDVKKRIDEGCDYIGLGPLHHTTTKGNLSPILEIEGVLAIINQLSKETLANIPIYVIGGVKEADILSLCNIGVHGVAISSVLTKEPESYAILNQLINQPC